MNEAIMYVYTDGDGTEHWFAQDADDKTQYVDMSGLNLTLTIADNGEITITDKGDGRTAERWQVAVHVGKRAAVSADAKRQRGRKVRLQREWFAGAENCQWRCDGLCAAW